MSKRSEIPTENQSSQSLVLSNQPSKTQRFTTEKAANSHIRNWRRIFSYHCQQDYNWQKCFQTVKSSLFSWSERVFPHSSTQLLSFDLCCCSPSFRSHFLQIVNFGCFFLSVEQGQEVALRPLLEELHIISQYVSIMWTLLNADFSPCLIRVSHNSLFCSWSYSMRYSPTIWLFVTIFTHCTEETQFPCSD